MVGTRYNGFYFLILYWFFFSFFKGEVVELYTHNYIPKSNIQGSNSGSGNGSNIGESSSSGSGTGPVEMSKDEMISIQNSPYHFKYINQSKLPTLPTTYTNTSRSVESLNHFRVRKKNRVIKYIRIEIVSNMIPLLC